MIRDSIIFWRLIQAQDGGQRAGIDASLRVLWFSQLLSQNEDFPWRLNAQPDHAFFDRMYLDVSANAGQENHFPHTPRKHEHRVPSALFRREAQRQALDDKGQVIH
jgi:hypothetical protein